MKAIMVGEAADFVLAEADEPHPARGEAAVTVEAIGLNRGDLRMAATMKPAFRPGWDFAGTIAAPADKRTEQEGAHVAGLLPRMGAWSERIAAPADCFAAIPAGVSIAVAAALPSAGLTALYALEEAGDLIGRRVLVTGASGGVGHLACQLAAIAGADVTGVVRSDAGAELLESLGVKGIARGADASAAAAFGPFDIVLDSVGGATLAAALGLLRPRGLCIAFGVTGGRETAIDAFALYQNQWRLAGFGLFPAIARGKPVREGLGRLLRFVADGRLTVHVGELAPWNDIAAVAERLKRRAFGGKAVLEVGA